MIGSEGTLAFIAEAEFETVPLRPQTTIALVPFARHRCGGRRGRAAGRRGGDRDRADGRPDADRGGLEHARHARRRGRSCPASRRRCWSSSGPTMPAGLDEPGGARARDPRRARAARARRAFSRDPEQIEMLWRVREGMQGLLAAMRAPGRPADHRGRLRSRPRGWPRRPRTSRRCSVKHGFLPGFAGHASAGNLHFLLTPNFGEPADLERYDAFMQELVELIVDKLRRVTEGRARHRAQHGAVRGARVGGEGHRDDVADQGARRSPTGSSTPGWCSTATRGFTCKRPQVDARGRGDDHQVHRVRVLRAGLPEPQRDHDPPPADRGPARDGPPADRLAGARRARASSTSTPRSRPVPPTARACTPARWGSTPASSSRTPAG